MSYIIFWAAERESRRQAVKQLFLKEGAMNPENAIEVSDLSPIHRDTLQRLIKGRVVLMVDGKHYFDLAGEENYLRRARRQTWFVAFGLALVATVLFLILNGN